MQGKVYLQKEAEAELIGQFKPVSILSVDGKIYMGVPVREKPYIYEIMALWLKVSRRLESPEFMGVWNIHLQSGMWFKMWRQIKDIWMLAGYD